MIGKKSIVSTVSILSLAALASCAPQDKQGTDTAVTPTPATPTTSAVATTDGTKTIVIEKSYAVGEYQAILKGSIVTENDTIKSITIDNPQGPTKTFADGISEKVIGQSIKGLQVDTISGASLTSAAFNEFLKTVN